MSHNVLISGASGHAMVVADILRLCGMRVVGFLDDVNPERKGEDFFGGSILGGREELPSLLDRDIRHIALGFGHCAARVRTAEILREMGFELVTAVHPAAVIAEDCLLGEGSVVCAGAVIAPGCTIGDCVIINTSASVDHECSIGDGAHISPGVRLAGKVRVGTGSWLGIGSCVADRISIGDRVIVGAGAVVVGNIPDGVLAYGVPARPVRPIEEEF